jgi:hypothetical protein
MAQMMLFPYYPGHSMPTNNYLYLPPATQATKASVKYPGVIKWFHFLDTHETQSKDGIEFSLYGTVLRSKGYLNFHS